MGRANRRHTSDRVKKVRVGRSPPPCKRHTTARTGTISWGFADRQRPSEAYNLRHDRQNEATRRLEVPLPSSDDVTALLRAWSEGDERAFDALVPLVYGELRRLARLYMMRERHGLTLQPTALVNEAYLRLVDIQRVTWQDRAHFLAVSARVMRRVLVDMARTRASLKRAGGIQRVSFDENLIAANEWSVNLVALDDALGALAEKDVRKSQVIELRFFGGLNVEETAEALHVSSRTVMRDWSLARAWLSRELGRGKDQGNAD